MRPASTQRKLIAPALSEDDARKHLTDPAQAGQFVADTGTDVLWPMWATDSRIPFRGCTVVHVRRG